MAAGRHRGFTRLLILNGHVTNFAPLRVALETLRFRHPEMRVALRGLWEISPRVAAVYTADAQDWHANAAETSLMLAQHPQGVRPGKIADDPDRSEGLFFSYPVSRTSAIGATGKPTQATAAQGETLLAWASRRFVRAGAGRAGRGTALSASQRKTHHDQSDPLFGRAD